MICEAKETTVSDLTIEMIYLIDTDIIIYSLKDHPTVRYNFEKYANATKMISAITYGELIHGAWKSRNQLKNITTVQRIADMFPVVDASKSVMESFGSIKADLQKQGGIIDDMDLIIAATAIAMDYTLVTNNEKHFRRISSLRIENWSVD